LANIVVIVEVPSWTISAAEQGPDKVFRSHYVGNGIDRRWEPPLTGFLDEYQDGCQRWIESNVGRSGGGGIAHILPMVVFKRVATKTYTADVQFAATSTCSFSASSRMNSRDS